MLLLDVMGTLVHDPFYREMPAFLGMSLDELLERKDPRAWIDYELGLVDEATLYRRFFADRRPIDGPGLRRAARGSYRLLEGIEPLLAEIRDRGVPMHALSNYPEWYRDVDAATGLSRYIDWSFVSCELGVRKPDPAIYQEALRRLDVPAASCVFVDDRERNVVAAREVGMTGVRFRDPKDLRARLGELEVL